MLVAMMLLAYFEGYDDVKMRGQSCLNGILMTMIKLHCFYFERLLECLVTDG